MATFTAPQCEAWIAPLISDAGNVYTVYGDYTMGGSEIATDVIEMVKVPRGASIIELVVYGSGLGQDANGNDVTVDVQRLDNNNAIMTGVNLKDAGRSEYNGAAFVLSNSDDVKLGLKLNQTPQNAAGKKVQLIVTYISTNAA